MPRRTRTAPAVPPPPPAAGPAPAALAPETGPDEPGRYARMLFLPRQTGGVRVNENNALTCSTVFACIRVICEPLGWLPCNVYERRADGGRVRQGSHPVDWLLSVQANPETTAQEFRETVIAHATSWGNGYAEVERDAAGRPLWLWQITPDRVCVERDAAGRIYYDVWNPDGPNTALPAEDVFHVKGLGFDGLVGYSVIRYAARSIGTAIAGVDQASSFFANDSTPGGILTHPGRLTDTARQNVLSSWQRRHGGPANQRVVAILEEGMTWAQTTMPPEDTQLVQMMQFSPSDICRFFRVQPHKVMDLSRATFSNIEQQNLEHVSDTLMPWAARFEQEANVKLFGRTNRGRLYVKYNFNALMRGDAAARAAFYHQMLGDGVLSINDVLELEDRNRIGADGDKRFVPMNMQLLENAGEAPPPGSEPAPAPTRPKPAASEPEADAAPAESMSELLEAHTPVIAEALGRCHRRAGQRAADALKRLDGDREKYAAWGAAYVADHEAYARQALGPAVGALLALAGGGGAADVAMAAVIRLHLDRVAAALAAPDCPAVDAAGEAGHVGRLVLAIGGAA